MHGQGKMHGARNLSYFHASHGKVASGYSTEVVGLEPSESGFTS